MSHELRTPLNGIIGILDIAKNKSNQGEVVEYLDLCENNAQLLLGLVNSLLDFQQIKQGKLKLNPVNTDIRKIINDIVQLFYFQYKQKNIFLKVEIGKEVPSNIYTDDCRFRQVLMNLLGNASKFTFKGGVMLRVTQDPECPDSLLIAVSDTGVGIRDSDKNKLFKIYGKLDDSENINRNGVELGLAISNTLAALLGGQTSEKGIEMISTYGLGTTFLV